MNTGSNHLAAANAQNEAIAKLTNDVIWNWDLLTNKVWWNEGFKNIFGYAEHDPTADFWKSKIHPDDLESVSNSIRQVIDNGEEKWSAEYRFARADGVYLHVFDRGYTILENGKSVRMIGSMIDISTQKELQAAKEETEKWTRFALDAAELSTWDFDVPSGMIKWDKRCRELWGVSIEEATCTYALQQVHPDDLARVKKAIQESIDPVLKAPYNIEFRIGGTGDKTDRWLRSKGKAFFDEDGTVSRLSGIVQDISSEMKGRREQDMLLKLVDNTPLFVAMATSAGNLIYVNPAGKALVGLTPLEDISRYTVKDFYPDAFYKTLEDEILPLLFQNRHWSGKVFLQHFTTGEEIPCYAEFITINDPVTGKVEVRGVAMRDLRQEYAAQAEQLKLMALVDNSVDLMLILSIDGSINYLNKAGEALLGLDEGVDISQFHINQFHTPEQNAFIQSEVVPNVLQKGRWSGKLVINNIGTGEKIPVENNCLRIDDIVTGEPIAIGAVMRDLRPEMEAQNEQKRLLALLEKSNDFVSLSDIHGNVSYVNPSGIKLMGFDSLAEARRHNSEYVMPDNASLVNETIYNALMTEGMWSGEVNLRNFKTNEVIPAFGTTMLVYDSLTQQPQGRATIVRDLRPERAARKALMESEQLFRNIATALPLILWMSNTKGEITFINQKWVEFLGLPPKDHFDGAIWHNAIVEEDVTKTVQAYYHAMQTATTLSMEYRVRRLDGRIVWTYSIGQPQFDAQGTYTGFLGYTIDISSQKELQRQKDEFIGIASHELKTPVTSIKAYAQLLKEMFAKHGETLETQMLTKMDGQITKLTTLIGDLLDVTKIQAGKLQFNDAYFNFDKLADEVVEDLQRTTNRHQIIRKFDTIGTVYGDEHRIGQVITNFLTNAIKYSPNADTIVVTTRKTNNEVQLSVQDFGIGIPQDNLEKVFEQFYRVSNNKQHLYPGLGLGLYIAAEIIRREGGRIGVESTEGKGSLFYFVLPADGSKQGDAVH